MRLHQRRLHENQASSRTYPVPPKLLQRRPGTAPARQPEHPARRRFPRRLLHHQTRCGCRVRVLGMLVYHERHLALGRMSNVWNAV